MQNDENKQNSTFNVDKMIFSLFGEIGLVIIGTLYVLNRWFDSCIELLEVVKDDDKQPMSETAKRMYS